MKESHPHPDKDARLLGKIDLYVKCGARGRRMEKDIKDTRLKFQNNLRHFLSNLLDGTLRGSHYALYSRFRSCTLAEFGEISETQFKRLKLKLHEESKWDDNAAINNFISRLNQIARKEVVPPSVKLGKRVRDAAYKDHKDLYEECKLLWSIETFPTLMELIEEKSYRLDVFFTEKEDSIAYMKEWFAVPDGDAREDQEKRELLLHINGIVVSHIHYLKTALDYQVVELLKRNHALLPPTKVKMWFVDVFDKYSHRFIPDWRQHQRRSKNKPDFKKSYRHFIDYINGATSKDLGYNARNHHHLIYNRVPQGLIYLLFFIYSILYKKADGERLRLTEYVAQVRKTLDNVPAHLKPSVLAILKDEVSPAMGQGLLSTYWATSGRNDYPSS